MRQHQHSPFRQLPDRQRSARTSDAVERIQRVIFFRKWDIDHFEAQVRSTLLSKEELAKREPYLAPTDHRRIERYVELVSALAEGRLQDARKTVKIETLRTGNTWQ